MSKPIECIAKRYRDWKRRAIAQKGMLCAYGGCMEDALACAAHLLTILEGPNPAAAIVEFAAAVETAEYVMPKE